MDLHLEAARQAMETNVHNHKCCQKQKLRRGLWSPDEDEKLKNHMMSNVGSKPCTWSSVPELTGTHYQIHNLKSDSPSL